ncbi:MAG: phosphate butyryltransferase, partial [candidate division Zixibacteria bacterium]|nr:phosphate butyryltransferase [candidate division Zixibacteria bacterium]
MSAEPITSSDQIIDTARALADKHRPFRVAVAAAEDADVLAAAAKATEAGIAQFTLYGAAPKLKEIIASASLDLSQFAIVDSDSAARSAYLAAEAADKGEADVIMKGFLSTSALLKTVLSRDFSLRGKNTLSHVAVLDIPGYHKLLGITDGGMVVKPTFEQKVQLIENAITLFHALGYEKPKVAVSAPVDYIHHKMPATTEAAQLTSMAGKGEIAACEVFGPLTFDAATSRDVASRRGIDNHVAGDADIFLVDSIEECNVVSKVMILFSPATFAGVIVGAGVPV